MFGAQNHNMIKTREAVTLKKVEGSEISIITYLKIM